MSAASPSTSSKTDTDCSDSLAGAAADEQAVPQVSTHDSPRSSSSSAAAAEETSSQQVAEHQAQVRRELHLKHHKVAINVPVLPVMGHNPIIPTRGNPVLSEMEGSMSPTREHLRQLDYFKWLSTPPSVTTASSSAPSSNSM